MAKKATPFHMHALTKGSAAHLLKQGHISKRKHNEIVAHAERGMARTRPQKAQPPVDQTMPQGGVIPSDNDGDEGF